VIWFRNFTWLVSSTLSYDDCVDRLKQFAEHRTAKRQWPMSFGTRVRVGDGFVVFGHSLVNSPYRPAVEARVEADANGRCRIHGRTTMSVVVWVEAFLLLFAVILGLGFIAAAVQGAELSRRPLIAGDAIALVGFVPLLVLLAIGASARAWIAWRSLRFATELAKYLDCAVVRNPRAEDTQHTQDEAIDVS
jgi:hypothetical protein